MKKIVGLCVILATICSMFSANAVADYDTAEKEPILTHEFLSSADICIDNGVVIITNVTQENTRSLSDQNDICNESVILVPGNSSSAQDIKDDIIRFMNMRSTEENYEEATDVSISAKAYSTVCYTKKTQNGTDYIKLTKAYGGITLFDEYTIAYSQNVIIECNSTLIEEQTIKLTPAGRTWTYTTGFDYVAITDFSRVGATYKIVLERTYNGTLWALNLYNLIVEEHLS